MLGQEWRQLVWDYLDLCDDEHSHLQEKFLRAYVKRFGFTAYTVPMFGRGVLSMQNMKYSKDYAAWMANTESLDALLEAKIHLFEIVPSGFSSDEDDDDDEDNESTQETEASPEEVLQYAWETVCYVIWGKASAKGGQKVVEAAPEELKELLQSFELDRSKVTDTYFLEMLADAEETKNDIQDGIQELLDGVDELVDHAVHVAKYQESPGRQDFCDADDHGGAVHRCLHGIMHLIEEHAKKADIPVRFAACKLAEGDELILEQLKLDENEKQLLEHIVKQMEQER